MTTEGGVAKEIGRAMGVDRSGALDRHVFGVD
jgi:hypothetical protein